jgi:hypothetical protein
MRVAPEDRSNVGTDSVFVIPIGPNCQQSFVADTIESIRFFSPKSRVIVVDDSGRRMGAELSSGCQLTVLDAPARGVFGGLYLNLSEGFREALTRPFQVLIRLDTDALIAGSDFEEKAIDRFSSEPRLGSLGSFRVGYTGIGIRSARWAKQRFLLYFALRAWRNPRAATFVARILLRARREGYILGDAIMGGAAIYSHAAIEALEQADLLGRIELAKTGLHEDYIFGVCLFSIGLQLGEFGNKYDDLPMGVDWRTLPASPHELLDLEKSIIHSTKGFEEMDETAIREDFRLARRQLE